MSGTRFPSAVRKITLIALSAALLECAKLALAAVPNVEVVTFLCALYGYSFGLYGVIASAVFVCIEPLIWGFGTWIISYFLYWPLVSAVFLLLHKFRVGNRFLLTGIAVLLTVWFGVLTSLVDVGLFTGFYERFFYRFGIYYFRGLPFYAIEVACNAVLFPTLFLYFHRLLGKIGQNFGLKNPGNREAVS